MLHYKKIVSSAAELVCRPDESVCQPFFGCLADAAADNIFVCEPQAGIRRLFAEDLPRTGKRMRSKTWESQKMCSKISLFQMLRSSCVAKFGHFKS